MNTKEEMLQAGEALMIRFCEANQIEAPKITVTTERWPFQACAYYRPGKIVINPVKCANIGRVGQCWSFPGYKIDRTPYGVIQHELGHHVDWLKGTNKGAYFSDFSANFRLKSMEDKLTNYCPNDAEWFAEMFRLYVTNPDLLLRARPVTWAMMRDKFKAVETRTWQDVLAAAPPRTLEKCAKFDW